MIPCIMRRTRPERRASRTRSVRRGQFERARAELDEAGLREGLRARLELPVALEKDDGLAVHVERAIPVELRFELRERHGLALDPARDVPREALDPDVRAVFVEEPVLDDV